MEEAVAQQGKDVKRGCCPLSLAFDSEGECDEGKYGSSQLANARFGATALRQQAGMRSLRSPKCLAKPSTSHTCQPLSEIPEPVIQKPFKVYCYIEK